ncbi:Holliday junction branch migration protein RuvA [Bacillus aquiflavi]|uniref:Holliday junction branch migration complex subunit RuvA n=1 Tax=Bacillus aquiflavi TaxID=2672567 RepID=A0A6B3VWN8_9BACI|nr:Holliday junction branch migration protein RuvA [Bacillus aquiflavi]MBA4537174.1 Holliday junction branch migration protein RuvA [Bacillus aquiflavi]NEY81432.1 Holliday junction branch migration protein RuvA [Bacillus aquiflavi]
MYEFIKGRIHFVGPEYVVIENNGIGYQIATPNPFVYSGKLEEEMIIYTYQHVREDILALYGFQSREEKALFIKLISVTGIGPKGALAILASGQPEQLVQAIEKEDDAFLMKFPGVGKKTARQMILDLKGKLDHFSYSPAANVKPEKNTKSSVEFDDAILALKALGYSERELAKITPSLQKEKRTTDQYIKLALQKLLK